ncbi:MAG: hypothetical protein WBW48_23600 [Anaerolineae bacterium]
MHRELKSAVFAVLVIAASYFFGDVCERIGQGYELIFHPSPKGILGLALQFFLALGAVAITAGLVAALVRPLWACFLIFALSALAMLLGWELKASSGVLTAVYFIASLFYAERIARELNDRLRFSVGPISQSQSILLTTLLIVACGSFYFGYAAEIRRDGFSIPPALVEVLVGRMEKEIINLLPADLEQVAVTKFRQQLEGVLDEMEKDIANRLPAAQEEAIMAEFRRRLEQILDEMEKEASERLSMVEREAITAEFREQFEKALAELVEKVIRPYERWIPVIFAISLFTLLGTITALLSWIPALALAVIFPLLTTLGVTKVVTETGIVRRLTLD